MSVNPSSSKDPSTAMIIEIVAGYFGLLGIGHLYAGRTAAGLVRLFGWWIFIGLVFVLGGVVLPSVAMLSSLDDPGTGIGILVIGLIGLLCLIPVMLAAPVVSGLLLKRSMRQ